MVGERLIGECGGARDERRGTKILIEGERGFGYSGAGEKWSETDARFEGHRFTGIRTECVRLGIGKVMVRGEIDNMEEKFL